MKKKGSGIFLFVYFVICVALNVALFLTLPEGRTDSPVFWIVWAFAFPLCFLAQLIVSMLSYKGIGKEIKDLPIIQLTLSIAFVVYAIVCAIFAYLPTNDIVLPIIIEAVITLAVFIIIMYAIFAHSQDAYVQQKIKTLRIIQSDLESCFGLVQDNELLTSLKKFADDIRYSDPMSHPTLSAIEGEISATVFEICSKVSEAQFDKVPALITKGKMQLAQRNSRCKILK